MLVALLLVLAACGSNGDGNGGDATGGGNGGDDTGSGAEGEDDTPGAEQVNLRLGYFPNVTHAPALVGVEDGIFDEALGDDVSLDTFTFNAGGEAIEALFAESVDISFIGPNPAINGFAQSNGEALRIISGVTSGGAFLITKPGIDDVSDLEGARLATPALGNTQDVALRAWLIEQGYETDTVGGGDVRITPIENAEILQAFQLDELDGAWVPEPWATRLTTEADGQVFLDERHIWPDGQFVTTHIIVSTKFLDEHPEVVRSFLEGLVEAIDFVNENPDEAQELVVSGIEALSGQSVNPDTIAGAWTNLEFTNDPIASSLAKSAEDAQEAGLLDPVDLDGIYDLTILNEVLAAAGRDEIAEP